MHSVRNRCAAAGGAAVMVLCVGGLAAGGVRAQPDPLAIWQEARLDVQRGEAARALDALAQAGLAPPKAVTHAPVYAQGVRAMAALLGGQPAAAQADLAALQADAPAGLARLTVTARWLATCAPACPAVPVDLAAATALPPAVAQTLLEGLSASKLTHDAGVAYAVALAAAAPWTDTSAPLHTRASLLAVTHAVLTDGGKAPQADALVAYAWLTLPAQPAVAPLVSGVDPAVANKAWGPQSTLTHVEALLEGNDNEATAVQGTVLCGGEVVKGPKLCPALKAPQGCRAAYAVGKALRQLRTYAPASTVLTAVVEHCPDHRARALYLLGRSLAAQKGKSGRAVAVFQRLARQYPTTSLADDALVLAGQLSARGKTTAARKAWEAVLEKFPTGDMAPEAHWFLAWEDHLAGKDAAACKRLDQMVEATRGHSALHFRRASYWRARLASDPADAAARMTALVQQVPQTFEAALARGWLSRHSQPVPRDNPLAAPAVAPAPPTALDDAAAAGRWLLERGLDADAAALIGASALWRKPADSGADLWAAWQLLAAGDAATASRGLRGRHARTLSGTPVAADATLWHLAYPNAHLAELGRAAQAEHLPPALMLALAREESAFDARVVSWAGAMGLTQLMPGTARDEAAAVGIKLTTPTTVLDPVVNARLGAAHLGRHMRAFHGNAALALGAYNAGASRVKTWLKRHPEADLDAFVELIPIDQTRGYIKRVLDSYAHYMLLTGKGALVLPQRPTDSMLSQ